MDIPQHAPSGDDADRVRHPESAEEVERSRRVGKHLEHETPADPGGAEHDHTGTHTHEPDHGGPDHSGTDPDDR